jgi:hypothetical protein
MVTPPNARIVVDGRRLNRLREKLTPGRHRLLVEAPGFRRYEAEVDITSNTVTPHTVQLQSATVAVTTPPTTTPTTTPASTGPAANCAIARVGVLNVDNLCYDVRPTPRTPAVIEPSASCTGVVTPSTVLLRVGTTGEVDGTPTTHRSSNCAGFDVQAVSRAGDLAFHPATKGGQPVAAWILLPIRPTPRPR